MAVVRELQDIGFVSYKINTTFLALIPKVVCPTHITDYRSISLLHGVYKILEKTLAIGLKIVLESIISPLQGTVVKGRKILEEILTANELVDLKMRSKEMGLLVKVDFRKTFDCISWGCIDYVPVRMGFGMRWHG